MLEVQQQRQCDGGGNKTIKSKPSGDVLCILSRRKLRLSTSKMLLANVLLALAFWNVGIGSFFYESSGSGVSVRPILPDLIGMENKLNLKKGRSSLGSAGHPPPKQWTDDRESSMNTTKNARNGSYVPKISSSWGFEGSQTSLFSKDIQETNILLFITTHFSKQHVNYLKCCWPRLMERSRLLNNVHVMVYSNNKTALPDDQVRLVDELFRFNPSLQWKFAPKSELDNIDEKHKQLGANLGMRLGFANGWFTQTPYDWVVRINPDVLIRNSTWIVPTLKDPSVDAIFHKCTQRTVHTDFFAIRPTLDFFNNATFSQMVRDNHEATATHYFQPILNNKNPYPRYQLIPDAQKSRKHCRLRGPSSSVYHGHESCLNTSMICDALEGWEVT
jgi:hypothetical protein